MESGQIYSVIQIPFTIRHRKWARAFLAAALWLPILLIFLDVLQLPMKHELPGVILSLGAFIQATGGLTNCAVLLGLLFLLAGMILYVRSRAILSSILYETVEFLEQ
jgi:hypothetical protein